MLKLLFIFTLVVLCQKAFSQVDPSIDWKMLKYPHFDVIYDAKHQELALQYGQHLEEIHETLKPYFSDFPDKTLIVINDKTDLTNGYATPIPYSHMVLFPVLPGAGESISDHGDWARELIMHEYTHILSFEPNRDVVTALRYIYGSIIRPTLLLPRWWLEGVAVETETRFTNHGRLRSPLQDANLRSYVTYGKLKAVDLGEINESTIPTWPGGSRPYLWGSLMWSHMIAQQGPSIIEKLHWRYGGRMPFFIEAPVRDYFQRSYYGLFEDMKVDLEKRVNEQLTRLAAESFTMTAAADLFPKSETQAPAISPDGLYIAFISKDETIKRKIKILKRESTTEAFDSKGNIESLSQDLDEQGLEMKPLPPRDAPPGGTISRISWFPSSDKFVYDLLDEVNRFKEISDLHTYDLKTKKSEQLTKGLRAREPSVSPDSKKIIYVQLGAASTGLGLYDIANKHAEVLYQPELFVTISTPLFWSDNEIIFSEKTKKGPSCLKIFSLLDRSVKTLFPEHSTVKFPIKSGESLLFVSSLNGVPNVYKADKSLKTATPLSHLKTAALQVDFDSFKKDLYLTELTHEGFQIRRLNENNFFKKSALPKVSPLFADRYPAEVAEPKVDTAMPPIEDYSVWPYLYPRYWIPIVLFDNNGALITASTSGMDPLSKHLYSVAATYDTYLKSGSYAAIYNNNLQDGMLSVKATDYKSYLINSENITRTQYYSLSSQWQLSGISTYLYSALGWNWMTRDLQNVKTFNEGPSLGISYADFTMSGAQVTPETGKGASLYWNHYLKNPEREGFDQFQSSMVKYWSKWLPQRHAVMTKLQTLYTADTVSNVNFEATQSLALFSNSILPNYLMRGYATGEFFGKSMLNTNLEYRFPIHYLYRGAGTTPLFIKRMHAAVIADGVLLDGYAYNKEAKVYEAVPPWKSYWSSGVELKADITLGFHIPMTFFLGYYWSLDARYGEGSSSVLGIQL